MCSVSSGGSTIEAHLLCTFLPCGLRPVAGGDLHTEWPGAWLAQCVKGSLTLASSTQLMIEVRPVVVCVCVTHVAWVSLLPVSASYITALHVCVCCESA